MRIAARSSLAAFRHPTANRVLRTINLAPPTRNASAPANAAAREICHLPFAILNSSPSHPLPTRHAPPPPPLEKP